MGAMMLPLTGCGLFEVNSFLDPTEPVIRPKGSAPLVIPIISSLDRSVDPAVDQPFPNATDVQPGDLVATNQDYRIGKNDLVSVSIYELMGAGQETVKTTRVTESGTISLPFIAPIKAEGLTEQELEAAVVKAYQDANLLKTTQVSVTVEEARARTFSILGNVQGAGQYQILQSDFRLLDAMILARVSPTIQGVDYCYIIRKLSSEPGAQPTTEPTGAPSTPAPTTDMLEPTGMSNSTVGQPVLADDMAAPATAPTTAPSLLVPGNDATPPMGTTADGQAVPTTVTSATTEPTTAPMTDMATTEQTPFQFNALAAPSDVRIIRVPLRELKMGALQYNVVIRAGDIIFIPDPMTGNYFMGGHVARTGVYSLTAQDITLKQAVVAAGMFDQVAIPDRTEIIRRIGENQEVFARVNLYAIFAGDAPDVYLKPNDTVIVGTNLPAVFIAAVRTGFRLTYGFGFLYDRNFT
jgi:polysaccharide biosynthesis/export protein